MSRLAALWAFVVTWCAAEEGAAFGFSLSVYEAVCCDSVVVCLAMLLSMLPWCNTQFSGYFQGPSHFDSSIYLLMRHCLPSFKYLHGFSDSCQIVQAGARHTAESPVSTTQLHDSEPLLRVQDLEIFAKKGFLH